MLATVLVALLSSLPAPPPLPADPQSRTVPDVLKAVPNTPPDPLPSAADRVDPAAPINPVASPEESGVEWSKVSSSAIRFLGVMHAFRWATEPGTRAGGFGLGKAYRESVSSLHGWDDGDPFYVNYVGHPMQGAVAGRLFLMNDPLYRKAEFGRSADYWKGKLRATAFAWAFSEQFETGPLSEASIGHIQRVPPQVGFVDHIVTPVVGMAWMLGEDALDEYAVKPIERRVQNKYVRMFVRSGLNPARSFANVLSGRVPWARDSRAGILTYTGTDPTGTPVSRGRAEYPSVAPFEVSATSGWRQFALSSTLGS